MGSFILFVIKSMTYFSSFILDKLSLSWKLKYLITLMLLKGWSRPKKFYPYDPLYYTIFLLLQQIFQLFFLRSHDYFSSYHI